MPPFIGISVSLCGLRGLYLSFLAFSLLSLSELYELCEGPVLCFALVVAGVDLIHVFMKLRVQWMRMMSLWESYNRVDVFHRQAGV